MSKRSKTTEPSLVQITQPEFNLTVEPWIGVVLKDGMMQEWGLIDLFTHLDDVASLRVESELEDPAIFRMLLAICYRALDPVLTEEWVNWWDEGSLPTDRIVRYLEDHKSDFWLFHPQRPFMQTLFDPKEGAGDPFNDLDILVSEPIGTDVESNRSEMSVRSMGYAEIARRLVEAQQYSKYGTLGSYQGAIDEIKSKVYAGPAYLGSVTLVRLVTGDLLRDMLLSLIPLDSGLFDFGDLPLEEATGLPFWEIGGIPLTGAGRKQSPLSTKTIEDTLTWASRRIRLYKMDDGTVKVLFRSGKHVYKQTKQTKQTKQKVNYLDNPGLESMVAFYDRKDKATDEITVCSWKAPSNKAFWRSLISLTRGPGRIEPKTLQWASLLEKSGRLPASYVGSISTITPQYVSQGTKLTAIIKDAVSLPINVLEDTDAVDLIDAAITVSETMVWHYENFVREVKIASGQDPIRAKSTASTEMFQVYDALGVRFAPWVSSLLDDNSEQNDWSDDNSLEEWIDIVEKELKHLAALQMRNATPASLYGRDLKNKNGDVSGHYSSADAENKLMAMMRSVRRKALGSK